MSGQVKELKSKVIAQLVVEALEDLKGESIRSIDVQTLTEITDYMVIVTGRSSTHIKALSDSVVKRVKEAGLDVLGMEGKLQSEWILVDVGGVVVHIMLGSVRALYNLEDLWSFDASKGAARTIPAEGPSQD